MIKRSVQGLIDTALPKEIHENVVRILDDFTAQEKIQYHALRTRQAGAQKFISVHILVPGAWTVEQGHTLLEKIESRLRQEINKAVVFTHLEPLEDPLSHQDTELMRKESSSR